MLRLSLCVIHCLVATCLAEPITCKDAANCEDETQTLQVSLLQQSLALEKPSLKATVAAYPKAGNRTFRVNMTRVKGFNTTRVNRSAVRERALAAAKSTLMPDLIVGDLKQSLAIWLVLLAMASEFVFCVLLTSCYDSEPQAAETSQRFPHVKSLDGMRTALITCVVLLHLGIFPDCALSQSGLTFFMTLSGFVRVLQKGPTNFSLSDFRKATAWTTARFFPANGVSLLIILACGPAIAWGSYEVFFKQALFVQAFEPGIRVEKLLAGEGLGAKFAGNGPLWFLSIVFWLTLAFPLLHNIRPRGHWSIVLAAIFGFMGLHYLMDSTNPREPMLIAPMVFCDLCPSGQSLPGRAVQYFLGMLTAQLFLEVPQEVRQWPHWGWIFDLCWANIIGVFIWHMRIPEGGIMMGIFWQENMVALEWAYLCALPGYLGILFAGLGDSESRRVHGSSCSGIWIRVLESWPMVKLGKYSLGCYVYHFIPWMLSQYNEDAGMILEVNWKYEWLDHIPLPWLVPLSLAWIMAILSEHLLESPIRMYIGYRILARMQPAAEASLSEKAREDQNAIPSGKKFGGS
mmetsp:Transcript_61283/g.109122  ORF Transcript_61283/g.109122 Transcript_61283/m.109122 type:complete len:572 (-) Transcript_61283:28-1743(-)